MNGLSHLPEHTRRGRRDAITAMRVALIGDLQYADGEQEEVASNMAQVRALKPDMAISLGDMGHRGISGRSAGMVECEKFLRRLDCPVVALLGNHDVEYRPDDTQARLPETWHREIFRREAPYQALMLGGVLFLCLSVERQPEETYLTQHALYISDAQYGWACGQLRKHLGCPTILVSHAPAPGSGLRCVPAIHAAATDAYLDHNFAPLRWRKLLTQFPQIRLWCSAHFHMGHDYRSAITWDGQTAHVSCGVVTTASRDGSRHTRILDIENNNCAVSTLDHAMPQKLRQDFRLAMKQGASPEGCFASIQQREVLLGEDRAVRVFEDGDFGRFYIVTKSGKLWEYDGSLAELVGAICLRQKADLLAATQARLYVSAGGETFSVDRGDMMRMERLSGYAPPNRRKEAAMPDRVLRAVPFQERMEREGAYLRF